MVCTLFARCITWSLHYTTHGKRFAVSDRMVCRVFPPCIVGSLNVDLVIAAIVRNTLLTCPNGAHGVSKVHCPFIALQNSCKECAASGRMVYRVFSKCLAG